ncbi:hypothetical protein [Chryseobacterium taihuense]|uniref:hypothetical protein n=1 Tax=Chryseobacterium taihuense TaxID=1141221 RepID=UPI00115FF755|nr:hypothetical protein [Chryseobacterium taihuense]
MILDSNQKKNLQKNEIITYHFSEDSRVFHDNQTFEYVINNDTLTFFDQIKEIDEVVIEDGKKIKKPVKNERKISSMALVANCKTAFLVKLKASDKIFINSINFTVQDKTDFDKNLGKIKIQILENKTDLPDNTNLLMEFEKNLSEFDLDFNNYQLAKMKIKFPRKLKYPKNGFFVMMEYIAPKSKYLMLRAGKEHFFWFYPNENKWKYMKEYPSFYYTLDIIK